MKTVQFILILLIVALPNVLNAQSDQKLKERQERRVDTIFSDEEKNSNQLWFYDNLKKMKLDQETEDLYTSIVYTYLNRMRRLDHKEKKEEIKAITKVMNSKIEPVLSKENFITHKALLNDLLKRVYEKEGWKWEGK